jgi:tRNA A37 threonylcarbamoyladenosine biosynthesis protein TsaE
LTLHIPALEEMEEMEEMGALLSVMASPPDAFLDGDLGAGNMSLSRGFIMLCKTGQEDSGMRVTSPTYLLSNTYRYQTEEEEVEDSAPPQE